MDTTSTKYSQSVFEAQIDKSTVESTREITFVIASESTGTKHRNKFMYDWDKWDVDSFNSNPIVGYQHNVYGDNMCLPPNPDDVIGKATAWIDTFRSKKVLMSKATFEPAELNPTADKVFRKIIWGSLNSSSTGVLPNGPIQKELIRNAKNEVVDYTLNFPGQTLVEWSIVHIPADPAALRKSMRSHTMSALSFVQKQLPELSLNDIKGMKIQELLDVFESKTLPVEEIEEVLSGPDPNLNKYLLMQSKFKNGQIKK
jgi:hypothetical protein